MSNLKSLIQQAYNSIRNSRNIPFEFTEYENDNVLNAIFLKLKDNGINKVHLGRTWGMGRYDSNGIRKVVGAIAKLGEVIENEFYYTIGYAPAAGETEYKFLLVPKGEFDTTTGIAQTVIDKTIEL